MSGADLPALPAGPNGGRAEHAAGLLDALAMRTRIVGALVIREMQTRFGRHNIGFVWLFLEPLTLGLFIGLMHGAHGQSLPGGVNPIYFSLVGYVPFFMFRAIVGRAGTALHANLTLLFHRQVTPFDIVLARNVLEGAAVLGVIVLIIGIASWVLDDAPDNVGLVLLAVSLSFLFAHGLSMCVAALCARYEGAERFIHPLTYLMLPFSGAFIAMAWLPPNLRELLLWSPLVHVHEAIREGVFGARIRSYADLQYFAFWIVGVNLVGAAALRSARRRLSIF